MVPVIPLAAGRVLGPASATPFFEDSLLYLLTTFQLSATQFPEEPKSKTPHENPQIYDNSQFLNTLCASFSIATIGLRLALLQSEFTYSCSVADAKTLFGWLSTS